VNGETHTQQDGMHTTGEGRGIEVSDRSRRERHDTRRGLGELVRELTDESAALLRAEIALAKAEMGEKVSEAQRGVVSMASGAAVLYAGVLTLIACAVLALGEVMPWWGAALIVGVIVTGIGALLVAKGKQNVSARNLVPDRTIRSVQQTADIPEMVKEQRS
jgi:hypothetical protein